MGAADHLTTEDDGDVAAFLAAVPDPVRRADAHTLVELMARATGEPPRMWGLSIVGFGAYHYAYSSGREGDMAAVSFSPRKAATTVYLMGGVGEQTELLERLGPHTTGKGCLYLKRLDGVDLAVLEEMVHRSFTRLSSGEPISEGLS